MTKHLHRLLFLVSLPSAALAAPSIPSTAGPGPGSASAPSSSPAPPAAPSAPARPRSIHRLDVSVAGVGDGPPLTFSLFLREGEEGRLSSQLSYVWQSQPSHWTRDHVGLTVKATYRREGDALVLGAELELSLNDPRAPADAHLFQATATVPLVEGQPTPLTSLYDLGTRRRYDVAVVARRVR